MTEITRHFTATTFVVWDEKVLLHCHPKQRLWLPPGGHIERDELPHDAARREVEEETGLQVRLHSEAQAAQLAEEMECDVVPQPAFILVEDINPFHQHVDFIYFAKFTGDESGIDETDVGKQNGFMWFSRGELERDGVPTNVKEGARRAIQHFNREPDTR